MIDRIYSPPDLAAKMVGFAGVARPKLVADFAAGGGELLLAAERRWPAAQMVATDLSQATVRSIARSYPHWRVGRCDFLSETSRKRCVAVRGLGGALDLVLLNPPFSCRGAARKSLSVGGQEVRCGVALAFVLTALPFVKAGGELIAVLPSGCLTSHKDRDAWEIVRQVCDAKVMGVNGHRTFDGCFPKTVLVRLRVLDAVARAASKRVISTPPSSRENPWLKVRLVRGTAQIHALGDRWRRKSLPVVHTTDLLAGQGSSGERRSRARGRTISGPVVFVPRVGLPAKRKIVAFTSREEMLLSDCVVALCCESAKQAQTLRTKLLEQWPMLERAYGGTCAPYITIEGLSRVLSSLGVEAEIVRRR